MLPADPIRRAVALLESLDGSVSRPELLVLLREVRRLTYAIQDRTAAQDAPGSTRAPMADPEPAEPESPAQGRTGGEGR